jgi:hypothetical protein
MELEERQAICGSLRSGGQAGMRVVAGFAAGEARDSRCLRCGRADGAAGRRSAGRFAQAEAVYNTSLIVSIHISFV